MELKRILAADTRSANERAIALYGQDVLVISNHTVNGQTELVVAIDLADPEVAASRPRVAADTDAFHRQFSEVQGVQQITPFASKPSAAVPASVPTVSYSSSAASAASAAPAPSAEETREYIRSREIVDMVRDELANLRMEFKLNQQVSGWQSNLSLSTAVQPMLASLVEAGVPTGLRTLLLDSIKNARSEQEALQGIRNQLGFALGRPAALIPQTGIHLIAGPSGAGKSLMTARLASQLASRFGPHHVSIISYQDLRVGAWSQTQILSAQMGVDCFSAHDPATLRLLLGELSQRGLILIDTPGVQMAERIAEVLAVCPRCTCHALVPADASIGTLNRVVLGYGIRWDSLMVSKLDEAYHPWPLLQFLCDNDYGISLVSDGNLITSLRLESTMDTLVEVAIAHLPLIATKEAVSRGQAYAPYSPSQRHFSSDSPWLLETLRGEAHD